MRFLISALVSLSCAAFAAAPADSFTALREQFANPPAEYRTMPFLVWNGEVTEADIDRDVAEFKKQGTGGFIIHPRPGMITPYMSDRWFALVRYTVEKAKKLGMQAWLYDENSYPSGFAGGHVPAEMPESYNEGQGLVLRKLASLTPDSAAKCKVLLRKSGDGFEDVTASAAAQPGTGEYACFELAFYPTKDDWFGGFSYVDLIRPGVTEKFIELTMRGYARSIGSDFGRTVPGIFTDEPNIEPPVKGSIRWTPDLFAQFEKRWGYDLRSRLVSLIEDAGDWSKVRHDYWSTLLDLFIERWSKPWHAYAEKSGLKWTGHYWDHAWPSAREGPDNMAMYAWHDVPGIDMLFNQFNEEMGDPASGNRNDQFGNVRIVKELASVANQLGRRRTLSETYGGGGWDLRFEDMKRLGDWEYVLGVNLMNQHLAFQTLVGARKYDYPQSFSYHEPWWNHYRVLGDYFGRLSLALSTGEQVNRTVILEPTSSAWMYARAGAGEGEFNDQLVSIEREFRGFLNRLETQQAEYDLGSEQIIRDRGKVTGNKFAIGGREYGLVVLPPATESLDGATVTLLADYLKAGGAVLSFVDGPARVDGALSTRVRDLAAKYATQWVVAGSPDDAAAKGLLLARDFSVVAGKLYHQRRRLTDGELLFFVNSSLDTPARANANVGGRSLMRLDPVTGAVTPFPARLENGRLAFQIELPPAGSLLVVASDSGAPASAKADAAGERPVPAAAPMVVKRASPNVLTIDYCDLKLGNNVEKDLYFYNAADKVFKYHGLDGDPWNHAVQYKTSILDKNHFAADSGFEAVFHFDMDAAVSTQGLQVVVERPGLWEVSVNGTAVKPRPGAWWLDMAFAVFDIGAYVKPGANAIALTARPMTIHSELEPVYILGDFGVAAREKGFRLVAPQTLVPGAWKDELLPFYSDAVSYARSYELRRGDSYKVRLGKWLGTVAEVKVNGKPAGVIGWAPYEIDITKFVKNGRNDVEVLVYGSLKNLLGPHHGTPTLGLTSPFSFRSAPPHTPAGQTYDLFGYGLFEDFRVTASGR
jgi:hypothetical protein